MRNLAKALGIILLNPAMWIVILATIGIAYLKMAGRTHDRFVTKANDLQLIGKTKTDVIQAFGEPASTHTFTNQNGPVIALNYHPGNSFDLPCIFYVSTNDTVTAFWDGTSQ